MRFILAGGVIRDSTFLDAAVLLPIAQRLISLEVHEESRKLIQKKHGREVSIWDSISDESQSDSWDEDSSIRLQVLERYLRPALVPNETWADIRRWQFHSRLLKWARKEYLMAKYYAHVQAALLTLRNSPQTPSRDFGNDLKKNRNLPSSMDVKKMFRMKTWKSTKDQHAIHANKARIVEDKLKGQLYRYRGGGVVVSMVEDPDTSVCDLSLEEILEVAGGFVSYCGPFNALCERYDIYQLWTREYIEKLGDYLAKRINSFDGQQTIILDVGAGDGLLVEALREYVDTVNKHQPGERVKRIDPGDVAEVEPYLFVATDNGSWSISQKATVEGLDVDDALEIYANEPDRQIIVLCSWMPLGGDWSQQFRDRRVEEYILIGEYDDGQCGDNWLTWGNPNFAYDEMEDVDSLHVKTNQSIEHDAELAHDIATPPYTADGYVRQSLDHLLPFQFSRFDSKVSRSAGTVSFRRIDEAR